MITLKIIESILSGYPLVNMQKTMEITMFNGKINYTWPFSIAMLNYQRVVRFMNSCSELTRIYTYTLIVMMGFCEIASTSECSDRIWGYNQIDDI